VTSSVFKGVKTESLFQNIGAFEISFTETERVQDKVFQCALLHILHKSNMLTIEVRQEKVCLFSPRYDQYRGTEYVMT
jgi:hypothetical protein